MIKTEEYQWFYALKGFKISQQEWKAIALINFLKMNR